MFICPIYKKYIFREWCFFLMYNLILLSGVVIHLIVAEKLRFLQKNGAPLYPTFLDYNSSLSLDGYSILCADHPSDIKRV